MERKILAKLNVVILLLGLLLIMFMVKFVAFDCEVWRHLTDITSGHISLR